MKHREEHWCPEHENEPDFLPGPPEPMSLEEEPSKDGAEPEGFLAIRRTEYIGRLHHMAFRAMLLQGGLPPAQAGALKTILRTPGMSQRELADALHIQRATATVMLQKMEKAGYIDRRPDPEDQRISRIYPTQAAKALDEEHNKSFNAYFDRCFAGFSQEELDAFQEMLQKLGGNLRAILNDTPEPPEKE